MSGSLFSVVIMLSTLISRMPIYVFLLLSIIVIFLQFVWHNAPYQWKVLPFGLATALRFSQPSLNLSCSFATERVSVLSIWITSLCWFTLSRQARGLTHFCVLYWFTLDCILIFPSLNFTSLRLFVFLGLCWNTVHMSVYLQLTLSFLQTQPVTVCKVISFLARPVFVLMTTPNHGDCVLSFRVIC